ncbi:MAG: zinc ribbon domain-containing protein [Candidatus Lokiarchaeota archaeon]|nr:zinc ribbon domain-containing protein [Candidatus Lokiarchaeota archaeon]
MLINSGEDFTNSKRRTFIDVCLFVLILISIVPISQEVEVESKPNNASDLQEPSFIEVQILENQSFGWFRSRFLLNISTNIPINMSYSLLGLGNNADKILPVNSSVLIISNDNSQIEIMVPIKWMVVPNSYQYQFTLYYINATTQIPQVVFEIPMGRFTIIMGLPLLLIIGTVWIIGIIGISVRSVHLRTKKTAPTTESLSTESLNHISPSISVPQSIVTKKVESLISCPECKKDIAEGSAFCPECGFHIPRFLRTKE